MICTGRSPASPLGKAVPVQWRSTAPHYRRPHRVMEMTPAALFAGFTHGFISKFHQTGIKKFHQIFLDCLWRSTAVQFGPWTVSNVGSNSKIRSLSLLSLVCPVSPVSHWSSLSVYIAARVWYRLYICCVRTKPTFLPIKTASFVRTTISNYWWLRQAS